MKLFSLIIIAWGLTWTFGPSLYVYAEAENTSDIPAHFGIGDLIRSQSAETTSEETTSDIPAHFGIGDLIRSLPTETTSNVPIPIPKPRPPTTGGTPKVANSKVQKQTKLHIDKASSRFRFSSRGKIGRYCLGPGQYFTGNGKLGKKGRILKRELMGEGRSTPMKHLFFRNSFPGMKGVCPKFNSFNDHEKLNFWIWYFAAIAATESDCGRNEYYPNDPNGMSVGELQVPEAYSNRKWRGLKRGAGGCEARPPKERPQSYRYKRLPKLFMASIDNNLSCGVEILGGVLCGFYKHPVQRCNKTTSRPYGNGFWKQLRRGKRGKIIKDVKRFPLCH